MKNTKTLLGSKARRAVLDGVNAIYEPVSRTLGPQAKRALLYRTYNRGSRITDDGVTVAEVQEPKDPFIKLAADTFKEMCKRTVERVGDGTTTTAVIGGKLMNDVHRLQSEGVSEFTAQGGMGTMDLYRKILASAEKVKEAIKGRKTDVVSLEQLEKVATISVKDAELGKVVAKMAWEVGVDGHIDVVEGYKGEIETEINKGMRFMAKPGARSFVNNPKRYEMVAADAPVLITNYGLDGAEVAPLLSGFNSNGVTKIIIIAPSFSTNVLVNMVAAVKAGYHIFPVAVPSLRTEQLEDLAIYCGASFVDKNKGQKLAQVRQAHLGFLEKLIVKDTDQREEAVATGGKGTTEVLMVDKKKQEEGEQMSVTTTAVAERIETLKGQVVEQKEVRFKQLIERRIASMASAVGVIRVGDSTQASSLYRKLKIEDAVYACKAALRGGYSKGGGVELKEIAEAVLDEGDILRPALIHPYELIQASMGGTKDNPIEITEDVIDPTEALYWAVEHATQVVAQLSTVEVITPEVEETSPGDGYMAIARMLAETVILQKRQAGVLQENEEEMERDRLMGLNMDEKIMLDKG